ncbi:right-handed parallel beta-helix repeat-containing protein [Modicisalibacter coralii]|uniref:right-handed parallel beta-helix repeat-containing protein n=1 Tax=Modicisalibacter coralii TaxID=2304602 RepID=UPI0019396326|nr:right-handed parallel beta-helix repeat-containing protein [Halomonas coralii]
MQVWKVRNPVVSVMAGLALLWLGAGAASAAPGSDCDRLVRPGENLRLVVDGLPDNGKHQTVCLGEGTFVLQDMLTLGRDNLTLRGQGREATVLQLADGTSSPVLVLGDARHQVPQRPIRQVTVTDLAIRGGGAGGSEFRPDLPYLSNSGLVVRRGEQITLRNLDVRHCRSACLLTEHHSRDVTIADNYVSDAQWDGISLNRAGPTTIVGNTIEHNVAAGITVEYLQDSEVRDNVITDNGTHGIYLADAEHNTFSNNAISDNRQAGVFLTCSIRERDPVQCWDDSFSRDNVFHHNRFVNNRFGYQVAVDDAANCLNRESPPNISRGDTFRDSPNHEPSWERYGRCIAYDGSRVLDNAKQAASP